MKKFFSILIIIYFLGMLAAPLDVAAEYVEDKHIDVNTLRGMSESARSEYIDAQLKLLKEKTTSGAKAVGSDLMKAMDRISPEKIEAWGTLFGKAIKSIAQTLNIEVNEFIKTPVGLFIAGLVFYKIAGKDVLKEINNKVFGTLGLIVTLFLIYFSYTRFHGVRTLKREKSEETRGAKPIKKIEYYTEPRWKWKIDNSGESVTKGASALFHVLATIVTILVFSIIII